MTPNDRGPKRTISLPENFRLKDFLSFHGRDAQGVSEKIDANSLSKGIVCLGFPARLRLKFENEQVSIALDIDSPSPLDASPMVETIVRYMMGITQDIQQFEDFYSSHPLIGTLVTRQRGLRVPQSSSPFEALTWAIIGQQISLPAAIALRRRLIIASGIKHPSGLYCYPDAAGLSQMELRLLSEAGLSKSKANTLMTLAKLVESGEIPLEQWLTDKTPVSEITKALTSIKGIGPWTVSYTLLRGFGWLDGSLHGDAAVRRGIRRMTNADAISESDAKQWLSAFSPYRALIAAHIWAGHS